jgi:hypothetical protein
MIEIAEKMMADKIDKSISRDYERYIKFDEELEEYVKQNVTPIISTIKVLE